MELYCGIDLHSTNSYTVVLDGDDRVVFQRRLANELDVIVAALAPFGSEISGIVVVATDNWYWLVDGLEAAGYRVHLANTWAIKQYDGLKHGDDRTDATWLARLLRLGLLPEGYIYPKAERGLRDLLRRRRRLVQQRTANLLSVQNMVARNTGRTPSGNRIKKLNETDLLELVGDEAVALAIGANLAVMGALSERIVTIEKAVLTRARPAPAFGCLLTVSGVGRILGLTILLETGLLETGLLETGDVRRFAKVGNFASYCRCVEAKRVSNGKRKAGGNRKCGNAHLAWAFVEAANFAQRYEPRARRFHRRKQAQAGNTVAIKALAHKLARASYYVMRDQVPFDPVRCFG